MIILVRLRPVSNINFYIIYSNIILTLKYVSYSMVVTVGTATFKSNTVFVLFENYYDMREIIITDVQNI